MRRTFLLAASALALAASLLSTTPAQGQFSPPPGQAPPGLAAEQLRDERRGLIYDGLRQRPGGPCGNAFEIVEDLAFARVRCTHGPDPAPDGIDVRVRQDFGGAPAGPTQPGTAAAQAGIPCFGTGSDGYRVQLLYVRRTGTVDNSASYFPNFVNAAATANATFRDSAAKTGGVRNIRFVTDASCNLVIQKVQVSATAIGSLTGMVNSLTGQGLTRSDRKYLAWVDSNVYCGIGEIYTDARPNPTPGQASSNYNNANPTVRATFARVDNGCWNRTDSVEAHELVHMLGGVQPSAPHATSGFHCRDESDRMCYVDASGVVMVQVCSPAAPNERLLDCNGDDYFNTNPAGGSWLATHWNVANSAFLATSDPGVPPPPTTTTSTTRPPTTTTTTSPTTTTTRPPTTTTSTTRPPTSTTTTPTTSTTTTTRPPTATTTTIAAPGPTPSAPRSLTARPFGAGVLLLWTAPATGPVTGYNVYRKTATTPLVKIADLGTTTNYIDNTAAAGVAYTYAVSAENGTREGPQSNQVTVSR